MAMVESSMLELDSTLPCFSLPNVCNDFVEVGTSQFAGKPVMVMFICNHCPFVIHLITQLSDLANEYVNKGFNIVAISSNDIVNYPQDNPERMSEFATRYGFNFPYCFDESQQVAQQFKAMCTPDFYIFDKNHRLKYRGQMDDSRPNNGLPITGMDLSRAMDAILNEASIAEVQKASIGCSIKWRAGNNPSYY